MSERIVCIEMLLAKYFTEQRTPRPAEDVVAYVQERMKGFGARKAEIREARKNLGIKSMKTDNVYVWAWENPISPEEMWKQKSEEFMRCWRER